MNVQYNQQGSENKRIAKIYLELLCAPIRCFVVNMAGLSNVDIETELNIDEESDAESFSSGGSEFLVSEEHFVDDNFSDNSDVSENGDQEIGPDGDAPAIQVTQTFRFVAPNDFVGDVGPVHNLESGSQEIDYFLHMLGGDTLFNDIARCTNINAAFKQAHRGKIDAEWEDTCLQEIKAYIGVLIYMGIFPLPETRDYWFSPDIECPVIKNCMTFRRYKILTKYFHIVDVRQLKARDDPSYNMLQRVLPLLQILDSFKDKYNPGRELAIDEAMIPFKGRNIMKQYIKDKPVKWGFKAWILATPKGYVLKSSIYRGKKEPRNKDMLLGNQVVMNFLEDRLGSNHHVYFDNFFSSVGLLQHLYDNGVYACSTTRPNRKDWPAELKNPKSLKLKRGESKIVQVGDVTALVWHDNRDICAVSSNCDPNVTVEVKRKTGKGNEQITVPCPLTIDRYTKYMGGVDRSDQKRSYYSLGRKTVKWWRYIFGFAMNTAIVNSFISYNDTNQPAPSRHGHTQRKFRLALYRQMINNFSSRKRLGRKRSLPLSTLSPKNLHKITKITGRKKVCAYCASVGRKAASGRGIQTTWQCDKCSLPLCRVGCFLQYHQERGVEV